MSRPRAGPTPAARWRARARRQAARAAAAPATPARRKNRRRSAAPCAQARPPFHVSRPLWSRLRLRTIDRDRNGAAAFVIIESLDPGTCRVAQAARLGAPGEAPLLTPLDEREAAAARAQEIGGPLAVGQQGCGSE